jgi:hypothetical protein
MRSLIQSAAKSSPAQAALLFGYFWAEFSKHPAAEAAATLLLEAGCDLWDTCNSRKLMLSVFHGLQSNEAFRRRKAVEIGAFFGAFLHAQPLDILTVTYSALLRLGPGDFFEAPIDLIVQHFSIRELQWPAVGLILRLPKLPLGNEGLFMSLCTVCQSSRLGFFGLCRLAESGEMDLFLRFPGWMAIPMLTFCETFRLFLVLAQYQAFRMRVAWTVEFGQLLVQITRLGDKKYIMPIASLLKRCPLDDVSFRFLAESGFLNEFFQMGVDSPDIELVFTVVASVHSLTAGGFTEFYLYFVPRIVEFLREETEMTPVAIHALVQISQFAQAGQFMRNNQMDAYFQALLSVPGYELLSQAFLANLENPPR